MEDDQDDDGRAVAVPATEMRDVAEEEEEEEEAKRGEGGPTAAFRASFASLAVILPGLRAIWSGKQQHVLVEVFAEDGLRFTTTDSTKSLECHVVFNTRVMDSWCVSDAVEANPDPTSFRVSLGVLIDCLSMGFSPTTTTLVMAYEPDKEILALVLSEGDVTTESEIRALCSDGDAGTTTQAGPDDHALNFSAAFNASLDVNRCTVASDLLRDALTELLDLPGASTVGIALMPQAPFLRLSTLGQAGCCDIDFSNPEEAFTDFVCPHNFRFDYRLGLLVQAVKPLSEAEKTRIRINADGMLALQHLIRLPDKDKIFVECMLVADVGLGEDE